MKLKRLAALLLALALLCTMAACNTEAPGTDGGAAPDTGDGASLTPTEIVASAMEKMAALKSMDAVMEMEMELSDGGKTVLP